MEGLKAARSDSCRRFKFLAVRQGMVDVGFNSRLKSVGINPRMMIVNVVSERMRYCAEGEVDGVLDSGDGR